ncbi:sensor histidine kinase [Alkalicoccus chagannorensis]|uniref:sensor histidine kinase n=1 Tax=Alkalicoccus chagannorensis TaxID=427072 RepID=UPI00040E3111|nr:HAMP domain-containing sensor histidine kinase [Alkalicoccus chagannorensis]
MLNTLQKRYFFFMLLAVGGSLLLMSVLVLWSVDRNFGAYLSDQQEQQVEETAASIERAYEETGSLSAVPPMLSGSGHEHVMVTVYDEDEEPISGPGAGMHGMMAGDEEAEELTYELTSDGEVIGYLGVQFPGGYGSDERAFLTELVLQMLLVFVLLTLAAAVVSYAAANRLTAGLRDIGRRVSGLKETTALTETPAYNVQELDELAAGVRALSDHLQREEERRRRFIGDVTHELRTPLAALRSQVEAFQDGVMEPTEPRLAATHAELMRLVRLVQEMERLFEAEGSPALQLERIQADVLLAETAASQEPMFQQKQLVLHTELEPVTLEAESDRLRQIVLNLLHNAWKFTPEGKQVMLRLFEEEGEAVIQVEDEGPGLEAGGQELVFDRFYQADPARTGSREGLGLGLSIAAAFTKAHGGTLQAENRPDGGARFILRLPAAETDAS